MVQIWYPAAEKQGDPEPYIRNINELSRDWKNIVYSCICIQPHGIGKVSFVYGFTTLRLRESLSHITLLSWF